MRIAFIIAALLAGCAPADHDITPEAGPQAGSVALKTEALVPCTAANICDALKSAVKAELNYRCGGGWSKPSGSCGSTWTASAPGRSATITRVSSTQRYVSASQCSPFSQACYCGSDGHILCD